MWKSTAGERTAHTWTLRKEGTWVHKEEKDGEGGWCKRGGSRRWARGKSYRALQGMMKSSD